MQNITTHEIKDSEVLRDNVEWVNYTRVVAQRFERKATVRS